MGGSAIYFILLFLLVLVFFYYKKKPSKGGAEYMNGTGRNNARGHSERGARPVSYFLFSFTGGVSS